VLTLFLSTSTGLFPLSSQSSSLLTVSIQQFLFFSNIYQIKLIYFLFFIDEHLSLYSVKLSFFCPAPFIIRSVWSVSQLVSYLAG